MIIQTIVFAILVGLAVHSLIKGCRKWKGKTSREIAVSVAYLLLGTYMIYCIGLKLREWL